MLTLIIVLLVASAAVTFVLIKKGKIADANNNNIPDAIEKPIEVIKTKIAEVKQVTTKAKEVKKPEPKKKMAAKPAEKKSIVVEKAPAKKPTKKNK